MEKLKTSNNPWKPIDEATARPKHIPSRVWRNIYLTVGSVLKSSVERKDLFERLLAKPYLIDAPAYKAAKELGCDRLFVENVQEQLRNYKAKHGSLPKSFLELGVPKLKGTEFPTGADDSIDDGQFKKLHVANGRYYLKIKLPVTWRKWKWFTMEGAVPRPVLAHLETRAKLLAPSIVKRKRKNGETYYALKLVLEVPVETSEFNGTVLGIDLAPGIKRLGVAVIHDGANHSAPVFFRAEKLVRKIMRIQKEIDRLEHKIDEAYRRKDFGRIPHLMAEQRRRKNKIRNLRKQILETFVNEVILVAIANDCNVIAIENLSGIKVPKWRSKALRFLFSQWFYSRFEQKLRQKAKLHGIKVVSVKPYGTSRYCSVCGKKLSGKGLHLECRNCKRVWDRDYNAAVNVANKGLEITTGRGQAEEQCSEAVRPSEPLRLTPRPTVEVEKLIAFATLIAYLKVVKVSISAHLLKKDKG